MATHSSVLAWRIPGTAEPGGLPSMGSHRVEHDWSKLAAAWFSLIQSVSQLFYLKQLVFHTWIIIVKDPFLTEVLSNIDLNLCFCYSYLGKTKQNWDFILHSQKKFTYAILCENTWENDIPLQLENINWITKVKFCFTLC